MDYILLEGRNGGKVDDESFDVVFLLINRRLG